MASAVFGAARTTSAAYKASIGTRTAYGRKRPSWDCCSPREHGERLAGLTFAHCFDAHDGRDSEGEVTDDPGELDRVSVHVIVRDGCEKEERAVGYRDGNRTEHEQCSGNADAILRAVEGKYDAEDEHEVEHGIAERDTEAEGGRIGVVVDGNPKPAPGCDAEDEDEQQAIEHGLDIDTRAVRGDEHERAGDDERIAEVKDRVRC
jgi:hypothetical protein